MKRLAIIDIGTNSIHMVLAEIGKDFFYKIVDRIKEMARLGDGAFTSHHLSQEAMDRGLIILKRFSMLANNKGFDSIFPIATSAVREAKNGGDFLRLVRKELRLRSRPFAVRTYSFVRSARQRSFPSSGFRGRTGPVFLYISCFANRGRHELKTLCLSNC